MYSTQTTSVENRWRLPAAAWLRIKGGYFPTRSGLSLDSSGLQSLLLFVRFWDARTRDRETEIKSVSDIVGVSMLQTIGRFLLWSIDVGCCLFSWRAFCCILRRRLGSWQVRVLTWGLMSLIVCMQGAGVVEAGVLRKLRRWRGDSWSRCAGCCRLRLVRNADRSPFSSKSLN